MVTSINNHVFFPHLANYSNAPEWSRRWQTDIAEGVTGAESRRAMRATPLISLSWTVTPWSLQEQAQLDDRIRAAKKAGKACAPYWGRASILQNDCTILVPTVVLQSTHWSWAQGDYIFFLDASIPTAPVFNLRQVTAVTGQTLTLDAVVTQTFPAGAMVWPLLFGRFEFEEMAVAHSRRGEARLKISEMISSAQQGNSVASGGIGVMTIGSTFQVF